MQLPETQNAHHVHAFKKGYRLALEGKPLTNMPSAFRYDRTLREYYEQGWSQATEELEAGYEESLNPPWRNRIAWLIVILIGSIVTAAGLINGIKKEQAEQQALILGNQSQQQPAQSLTPSQTTENVPVQAQLAAQIPPTIQSETTEAIEAYNKAHEQSVSTADSQAEQLSLLDSNTTELMPDSPDKPDNKASSKTQTTNTPPAKEASLNELSLLTDVQRKDLVLNQEELEQPQYATLQPQKIIDSDIMIEEAEFTSAILNKQVADHLGANVPKNIRTLYFFTQLKGAEKQTIYHRWVYKNQEMALIPLQINSNLYRTWSSKRLTSAWQGEWTVEILNANKEVIYRQTFQYGKG